MILVMNCGQNLAHVTWCLGGSWEFQKLIISGISGLALHWYVSGESLAGTAMACMSMAFVLIDIIKLGNPGGEGCSREGRARSRVHVEGRERKGVQGYSHFGIVVVSQPGIIEVLAFLIGLEKGQPWKSGCTKDSAVLYEYE